MVFPSPGTWALIVIMSLGLTAGIIAAAIWLQRDPHEEEHLSIGEFWMLAGMASGGLTLLTPLFWIPVLFDLNGVFGFTLATTVVFPAGCLWVMWVYSMDDFSEAAVLMMVYMLVPIFLAFGLPFLMDDAWAWHDGPPTWWLV